MILIGAGFLPACDDSAVWRETQTWHTNAHWCSAEGQITLHPPGRGCWLKVRWWRETQMQINETNYWVCHFPVGSACSLLKKHLSVLTQPSISCSSQLTLGTKLASYPADSYTSAGQGPVTIYTGLEAKAWQIGGESTGNRAWMSNSAIPTTLKEAATAVGGGDLPREHPAALPQALITNWGWLLLSPIFSIL